MRPSPRSRVWMASSKSCASTGSMVKMGSSRRSRRLPISFFVMVPLIFLASRSTSFGNEAFAPCEMATASTSTPGASARPRMDRMRPSGADFGSSNESMDATTLSPVVAPFHSVCGT